MSDNTEPDVTDPAVVAAFITFHHEAAPKLVAFLRANGASLADAAECVQETLTLAFEKWKTIREPYAWCRRVASRLYVRSRKNVPEEPRDDLGSGEPGTLGAALIAPGTDLEAFELRHTLLDLLDLLSPRQRQVMAWTYDGASTAEIAEELHLTPSAVTSHLHRARAKLRPYWRKSVGEDQ